jgi:hypothetical protein
MTIRYTCVKCGSVLKIDEDRAGKEKHCPKCKTSFIVPTAEEAAVAAAAAVAEEQPVAAGADTFAEDVQAAATQKISSGTGGKSTAAVAPPPPPGGDAGDADFDPVAFLMTEGSNKAEKKSSKPAAAAATDQPDLRVPRGSKAAAYTASDEPDVRVGGPRRPAVADADDDSAAEAHKRKPKRPAPASAAQTADEMLKVNASTNAKELLTKTMEESRIRAAQMPEERKAPGVDYKETARELGLRFAPAVLGGVAVILFAYWFGNYMAGGGPDLPPLGEVSGTVTKEGKPLVNAYVSFIPVDEKAGGATAYTDDQGYYELKYTEGVDGAVVGKNRVEVSLVGPDGREVVPATTPYGLGSREIEEVKEGSQTIDIKIP